MCKECLRAFARQDALSRHEKLHTRTSNPKPGSRTEADSINGIPTQSVSPEVLATPTQQQLAWGSSEETEQSQLNETTDIDFSLIWPDSETLFQSIMATGTADQWHTQTQMQMPLGTLPFPPVVQDDNAMNVGVPESFEDRGPSIGAIPSGGSHQAVRDVTEMVTNSVRTVPLSPWDRG